MKKCFFCVAAFALLMNVTKVSGRESEAVSETVKKGTEVTNVHKKSQSDAAFFRAHGAGDGRHLDTAKIKAQMAASAKLSDDIQTWMKSLITKYIAGTGENAEEYIQAFEQEMRNVTGDLIGNVAIASNKTTYSEENNLYSVSLVLEIKRKKIFEAFSRSLSTQKKWEGIYDGQKFEKLYDAEIEELKARSSK